MSVPELLARHAPVLQLDCRELFRPTTIDGYVESATLCGSDGESVSHPKVEDLDERWAEGSYLKLISEHERRTVVRSEVRRAARKLLTARLGQVGLIGRLVDVLFQLSLWFRPTTPRLTTAAALAKAERLGLQDTTACYGRLVRAGGWVVLHYAYFWVMNDWRTGYDGLNDHEADWEQAWVYLDPGTMEPVWIMTSNHDRSGSDLRRHWDDPELTVVAGRPVLHAAAGSHALFFQAGDYVTRVDVPVLRWLLRLQAWFQQILRVDDDADRGVGPRFGVAFIDAARGDGDVLSDFEIRPLAGQAWVERFRGLWGLDSGDRTNTERGPSGPKFDRSGEVRGSWADPVGFAGLHGTPPPSAAAGGVTLERVQSALEVLDGEIAQRARLIPLAAQAGSVAESVQESERLTEVLRQRCELVDLRRQIASGRTAPRGIRDHLQRPPRPLEVPRSGGWLLAGWAALSMPILFGAMAAAVIVDRVPVGWTLFAVVCMSLLMEHLVRHRFEAVLRLLALQVAAGAVLFFATGLLLSASQLAVGALLVGVAVAILVMNIGELRAVLRYRGNSSSTRSRLRASPRGSAAQAVMAESEPLPNPAPLPSAVPVGDSADHDPFGPTTHAGSQ